MWVRLRGKLYFYVLNIGRNKGYTNSSRYYKKPIYNFVFEDSGYRDKAIFSPILMEFKGRILFSSEMHFSEIAR